MTRNLTAADGTVTAVAFGEYRKVGARRTGTARLIVSADALIYCNRRGEESELTEIQALKVMATGINTLMSEVAPRGWDRIEAGTEVKSALLTLADITPFANLILGPKALLTA